MSANLVDRSAAKLPAKRAAKGFPVSPASNFLPVNAGPRVGSFQLDDDALTTVAAVSVVGLGILVSGFVILNVVSGVEAPSLPSVPDPTSAIKKLPDVPSPLPSKPAGAALSSSGYTYQAPSVASHSPTRFSSPHVFS